MKSDYFCIYHIQQLISSESEALQVWTRMMHNGIQAYSACQTDKILHYFGSALDVALIRYRCNNSIIFNSAKTIKPAEFLIQTMLSEDHFSKALTVLSRISSRITEYEQHYTDIKDFLEEQYSKIEVEEKKYIHDHPMSVNIHTVPHSQYVH